MFPIQAGLGLKESRRRRVFVGAGSSEESGYTHKIYSRH